VGKNVLKPENQPIKDELLKLTHSFCKQHLNDEYADLSRRMIDKMSRKRQVPYLSGRREIWAAAIIHALGTINFLFDPKTQPYVTALQIAEHFGTSASTVAQKGKVIRDMFKLSYWDREFSTLHMQEKNPFNSLALINGFLVAVQKGNRF
jgi:hypothetical protein